MSEVTSALRDVLSEARNRGFIGPAPLDSHIEHAEGFVRAIGSAEPGASVLDLGSGGGIPGLVIAARCPAVRLTLLDGRTQTGAFLTDALRRLGWMARVEVLTARAEDVGRDPGRRCSFDVVVARGFGPPPVTAECAAPLLRTGGALVVSEPPADPDAGSRWPTDGCAILGLRLVSFVTTPYSFAVLRQDTTCSDRYPRRVGVPGKRPLF